MVYTDYSDLGWKPYVHSWIEKRPKGEAEALQRMFDKFINKTLTFKKENCEELVPIPEYSGIVSLCKLFSALATPENGVNPADGDNYTTVVEMYFVFSMIWSVCAAVDEEGRKKIDSYLREMEGSFPNKVPGHEGAQRNGGADTVYEYFVDPKRKNWASFEDKLPKMWRYPANAPFYKIIVPTVDTVRYNYLVNALVSNQNPVLLVGPVGTGKTSIAQSVLQSLDNTKWAVLTINMSAQTTSNNVQNIIESRVEKRTKGVYVPMGGKSMITFMDDLNMPAKDTFGSQPPLELLRLWIDYGFWYDREKQTIKYIKDAFIAILSEKLGSFFDLTFHNICPSKSQPIFGDFMREPRVYEDLVDLSALKLEMERVLDEYNQTPGVVQMHLVLFRDAIEHITRIVRVIGQPRGNMLLVGIGGSGRQSLARLASFICEDQTFQIEVTKHYRKQEFRDDIKKLYRQAGVDLKPTTFLFVDTQIMDDSFLEDINNILSSGEVPNLYKADEFEEIHKKVARIFVTMHWSVASYSQKMLLELRRHNYVTPTNYLELVSGYKKLLTEKRKELSDQANKLRSGLSKIDETRHKVEVMSLELEDAKKKVAEFQKQCEEYLVIIVQQKREADEQQKMVGANSEKIAVEEIKCKTLADNAQKDLEEALPALEEAMKALESLNKKDMTEIKSYGRPPTLVETVMQAVMILRGNEPTWAEAKRQLGEATFIKQLINFDKDNISDKVLKKISGWPLMIDPQCQASKWIKNMEAAKAYRPCAQRASILFFVLNDMGRIDPMYQFSLDAYIDLFNMSIHKSHRSSKLEERIRYLNEYHTYAVYRVTCRGLFERHKLLFSFQTCAKILETSGSLKMDEYNFFLRGGVLWPGEWENSCNQMQRMLVVRSLRPDRVAFCVTYFIVSNLGSQFIELNMRSVVEDSTPRTPLIFVLSPGVDPTSSLLQLAEQSGMAQRFHALSLGQGQAPIATHMIQEGVRDVAPEAHPSGHRGPCTIGMVPAVPPRGHQVLENLLSLYLDEYEETPWDALKYLIAGVNYGGHVTDSWDRRLLTTYINDYFCEQSLVTPFYKLSVLDTYYIPKDGILASYREYISMLPGMDLPEAFGQHPNADVASQITEARTLFETLLSLQPQITPSGAAGQSREDKVLELSADVLSKIPQELDYRGTQKVLADDPSPLNVVLLQEIQRYNALLQVIRSSLVELEKGIQGLVVMSTTLEEIFNCIFDARVPPMWERPPFLLGPHVMLLRPDANPALPPWPQCSPLARMAARHVGKPRHGALPRLAAEGLGEHLPHGALG
ncbi:Dynein heavy chain 2, axonemal [Chelonia mydas]|uniref:Dynein heavy chain 2, axonemal n=1 Tax=Chelonia mydas TaxID=8469 RepID=M7CCU6_CHEMY|nr:Dynein heavy chain 2, axonemal [Chelonia mydas]